MFISFRGAIGAGKTEASTYLVKKYGFVRVSFADPLKLEVFDFLWRSYEPVTEEEAKLWKRFRDETGVIDLFPVPDRVFPGKELYDIGNADKLAWVNSQKATLRPLLQWWGTEYRRAENEDYWVDQAETFMTGLLTEGKSIVMDDARFENEFELIEALGGVQVFIDNPNAEKLAIERSGGGAVGIKGHESEKLLDKDDPRNTTVILNDQGLEEFHTMLDVLLQAL